MIEIVRYNVPGVMLDNDMQMFNILFKTVEKIDANARVAINKVLINYKIMITVSNFNLKDPMVIELKKLSDVLGDIFDIPKTQFILNNIFLSTK